MGAIFLDNERENFEMEGVREIWVRFFEKVILSVKNWNRGGGRNLGVIFCERNEIIIFHRFDLPKDEDF